MIPSGIIYIGTIHLIGFVASVFWLTYHKLASIKDDDLVSNKLIEYIVMHSHIWEIVVIHWFIVLMLNFFKKVKPAKYSK
mgnify:CR=1 FL=1